MSQWIDHEHCLSKIYSSLLLFLKLFDSDVQSSVRESDFRSDPDKMPSHMSDTETMWFWSWYSG